MRVSAATSVLARAVVLLARHWPTLIVIWLLGWLGREQVVRLAVRASKIHAVAGVLVLALAIVAEMAALVWMLRVVRTSAPLPRPEATTAPAGDDAPDATRAGTGDAPTDRPVPPAPPALLGRRWRHVGRRAAAALDSTASVLVPFLAIYVAQDSFRVLFADYGYRVTTEDAFATAAPDPQARLPWGGWLVLTTAAVAFLVRWLLRRSRPASGSRWSVARSSLAAYVEVIWLVLLVAAVNSKRRAVFDWLDRRRVVRAAGDVVGSFVDRLGALTDPLRWVWDRVSESFGALDKVLLLPVATLTVAAVVYGATIARPPAVDVTRTAIDRLGRLRAGRALGARIARRRGRRLAEAQLVRTGSRFQPMVDGVRLLVGAGLVPMLVFCVAFGALQTLDEWMWFLWRPIVGPHDLATWIAASEVLGVVNDLTVGVLSVVLIGAAVERVTSDARAHLAAPDGPAGAPASPDLAISAAAP